MGGLAGLIHFAGDAPARALVERMGESVAVRGPGYVTSSSYTTPEADDLVRYLAQAVEAGATHLVMEVSSHGLELERVAYVRFDVCGFTNLTQDHLDFHPSMEAYGEAKARLFTEYAPRVSVICVDGEFGAQLATRAAGEVLRCSVRADSDAPLRAVSWTMSRAGIEASLETPAGELRLMSPMVGAHNLENLLVAVGCAASLGVPWDVAVAACAHLPGAPGRLERVPCDEDVAVFVDYAHTPDALERTVRALRALTPGRLITVFGCGGDRDKGKRPLMARAACGAGERRLPVRVQAPRGFEGLRPGCSAPSARRAIRRQRARARRGSTNRVRASRRALRA